ncbi:hypothetical protein NQ314_012672 [Rhamnusium bicolor]|uniref:PITH domain-containing protein n=1 Tax=Rhamnusium bicolor TaxID=1586634 RepID=A0AAV8XB90_9CUCU|nr:hypothetical protein NQ314_012672 [Rhamnusium bicolor]
MAPHGKCCGDANHQHETEEIGIHYSLYTKINKDNLQCLNEVTEGSGKTVFKTWEERLNFDIVRLEKIIII